MAEGVIDATDPERMIETYRERLEAGHPLPETAIGMIGNEFTVDWSRFENASWDTPVDTAISTSDRTDIALAITRIPQEMTLHPRVARIMSDRQDMAAEKIPMDWGFAEMMAYGALLKDGCRVRLTGQDSRRGAFFHRHAALTDQGTGRDYYPLDDIDNRRGSFTVTDSLLSEEAVLGFEYGYSTTDPDTLVIWEAQFGDFCNGAQVVIDQFISSGETKWGRLSGLTLFLPHGQEGQGPEHSSAAPGAISSAVCRTQPTDLHSVDTGADFSLAQTADVAETADAPHHHDSKESVTTSAGKFTAQHADRRAIRDGHPGSRRSFAGRGRSVDFFAAAKCITTCSKRGESGMSGT